MCVRTTPTDHTPSPLPNSKTHTPPCEEEKGPQPRDRSTLTLHGTSRADSAHLSSLSGGKDWKLLQKPPRPPNTIPSTGLFPSPSHGKD